MNAPAQGMTAQRQSTRIIALHLIDLNPDQPRTILDEEEFALLKASIREHGVRKPILVRPHGANRFQVVGGERRVRACKELEITQIEATVRDVPDKDLHFAALAHNFGSAKLSPRDTFQAIVREIKNGREVKEIAQALCKSEAFVYSYLSLQKLAPVLQAQLEHKKREGVPLRLAVKLAKIENQLFQVKEWGRVQGLTPRTAQNCLQRTVDRVKSGGGARVPSGTPSQKEGKKKERKARREQGEIFFNAVDTFLYTLKGLPTDHVALSNLLEALPTLKTDELEEKCDDIIKQLQALSKTLNKINSSR